MQDLENIRATLVNPIPAMIREMKHMDLSEDFNDIYMAHSEILWEISTNTIEAWNI